MTRSSHDQAAGRIPYSFEIYPPRTPSALEALLTTIGELAARQPDFISVTYGAGGSSHASSLDVLRYIRENTQVNPLAHLTCVGNTRKQTVTMIHEFMDAGIDHFLALRGDPPKGFHEGDQFLGDLNSAAELVELLRQVRSERRDDTETSERESTSGTTNDEFGVAVAAFPNGHPNSRTREQDIDALLAKQGAGADFAITQLFFRADDYHDYVNAARAAGVTIPILPGIMPVTSASRLVRVHELTGEPIPQELHDRLEAEPTSEGRVSIGVAYAVDLVNRVIAGGARGVHLYAFNHHETVLAVLEGCGLLGHPAHNTFVTDSPSP